MVHFENIENEENFSPMVHHLEKKNENMNSITSYLREHYSLTHFDVEFFLFV